jgi:ribonuclease HI
MLHYAWGLGTTTNNIAEAYALYVGLKLVRDRNIPQLSVSGDSMLILNEIINKHYMENNILSGILQRITTLTREFEEINLYHVKRNLKPHDELMEKRRV